VLFEIPRKPETKSLEAIVSFSIGACSLAAMYSNLPSESHINITEGRMKSSPAGATRSYAGSEPDLLR